jgi:hypothetical protein
MAVDANIFYNGGYITNGSTITFNTTWVGPIKEKDKDMITKISELAAGWVGTVFTHVDGKAIAVADTRPCKSYEAAERKARKLALSIVKNGYSE